MTKEELKNEAEKWLNNESKYLIEDNEGNIINIAKKVKEAYLASAELREKRIAELEKENAKLTKARELLKNSLVLWNVMADEDSTEMQNFIAEAENFLKESEVEK